MTPFARTAARALSVNPGSAIAAPIATTAAIGAAEAAMAVEMAAHQRRVQRRNQPCCEVPQRQKPGRHHQRFDCSGGQSDAKPNAGALLTCAPKEKQH